MGASEEPSLASEHIGFTNHDTHRHSSLRLSPHLSWSHSHQLTYVWLVVKYVIETIPDDDDNWTTKMTTTRTEATMTAQAMTGRGRRVRQLGLRPLLRLV